MESFKKFPRYALELIVDTALGIFLGILIDKSANAIGSYLELSDPVKLSIQFFLIILVLYIMKINSKYFYESWHGPAGYGIIFIAVFLASQKNLTKLMLDIYGDES